jgi:hypothetical protein
VSPDWELNFSVVIGVSHSADHRLVKMILGHGFEA